MISRRVRQVVNAAAVAALVAAFGPCRPAWPDGVELTLTDGSRVVADRLSAADGARLTVAAERGTVRIERTLGWGRVESVTLGGMAYPGEAVRRAFAAAPEGGSPAGPEKGGATPCEAAAVSAEDCGLSFAPPALPRAGGGTTGGRASPPGRVIGVRLDPLAAYADLAPTLYRGGVPSTEAPFALAVFRGRRLLDAGRPPLPPNPWPAWPAPGLQPWAPYGPPPGPPPSLGAPVMIPPVGSTDR